MVSRGASAILCHLSRTAFIGTDPEFAQSKVARGVWVGGAPFLNLLRVLREPSPDKLVFGTWRWERRIFLSIALRHQSTVQTTSVLDHRRRQGAGVYALLRLRGVYSVFTKLGDGEFLFIASREELEQAAQLVQELNANWPNEYVIRDSNGNDVDPKDT